MIDDPDRSRSHWARRVALALAAIVGAVVAWGWFRPEEELEEERVAAEPTTEVVAPVPVHRAPQPAIPAATPREPPPWVKPTIVWTIGVVLAAAVAVWLLGVLQEVVFYLVLALFFSFALEPAVNYIHARWRWRRGTATASLLALVFLFLLAIVLVLIPAVLQGAAAIADAIPDAAQDLSEWSEEHLDLHVETTSLESGAQDAAADLGSAAETPLSVLLGFTASLIGGLFALFTVAMFIFYMVAEAPRFRHSVLSFFEPKRQEELLSIWEAAIEKTGGYFYSRLLLAGINGGLFFVVLRIVEVPGAAALAFFEGTVAAFIPIVGTYVAATVPILVAAFTVGWDAALVLLIYVLIYQQVENYLISPRVQGKTMQLHPAIAFGAALAGGAIGGLLWAFLALPFAATVQASASLWIQHHEVVESALTQVETPIPPAEEAHRSLLDRGRRWLRSSRGWLRRHAEDEDDGSGSPGEADRPAATES
jgi:predicted PurR-regulated permease PerM